MIKIRENVFETNSSSTHSISIRRRKIDRKKLKLVDGKIIIKKADDLDFYFEINRVLNSQYDKLCYAIYQYGESEFNKVVSAVRNITKNENCEIVLPKHYDKPYYGSGSYVYYDLDDLLKYNKLSLEKFITDPEIVIICDDYDYKNCNSGWYDDDYAERFKSIDYLPQTDTYHC